MPLRRATVYRRVALTKQRGRRLNEQEGLWAGAVKNFVIC